MKQREPTTTQETEHAIQTASKIRPAINEKTLRQIDLEAFKRCKGDAALWQHHRALLEGEFYIGYGGKENRTGWVLTGKLPQFKAAEASVIEGWRKLIKNTMLIKREQQADGNAINRAIIFDACRRAKKDEQIKQILKERADSIGTFAASGDVSFFRSLGRLLSPLRSSSSLRVYDYAHTMLSHWLTSFLWLMPERTASDCLAGWLGREPKTATEGDKELRHFKEIKRDYKLRSHKPSLIYGIEANGNLIITPYGRSIFRSLISSK